VRVSSLLSLVANTGLGLLTSWTSEEIQWNSNDLDIARVLQGTLRFYLLLLLNNNIQVAEQLGFGKNLTTEKATYE
jgi:hypothetical protein